MKPALPGQLLLSQESLSTATHPETLPGLSWLNRSRAGLASAPLRLAGTNL
jgi:hypothetical protein